MSSLTTSGMGAPVTTDTVIVVLDAAPVNTGPWPTAESGLHVAASHDPIGLVEQLRPRRPSHVVLCCAPAEERQARYLANVVTGALPGTSVAVLPMMASGLAMSAVGVRTLEGGGPPAAIVATLRSTVATAISGFWLQRLSKLSHPQPTFGQHVSSLFGKRGYVVTLSPRPEIRRPSAPAWPPGPQVLVGGSNETGAGEATARLGLSQPPGTIPPVTDLKARYSSPGVEFLILPDEVRPTDRGYVCPSCTLLAVEQFCPFCHNHVVLASQENHS